MYPSEIDDRPLEMHAAIQEKVGTPKSRTIDQDKMIKIDELHVEQKKSFKFVFSTWRPKIRIQFLKTL